MSQSKNSVSSKQGAAEFELIGLPHLDSRIAIRLCEVGSDLMLQHDRQQDPSIRASHIFWLSYCGAAFSPIDDFGPAVAFQAAFAASRALVSAFDQAFSPIKNYRMHP